MQRELWEISGQSFPGQAQYATPLCDEHVPERFWGFDHVRSLQRAVAPEGLTGTS